MKYDDGNLYPCKLVACILGVYNEFEGHALIVQKTFAKNNTDSMLFTEYKFCSDLIRMDADCVQGQCFVVESNLQNGFVSLALNKNE